MEKNIYKNRSISACIKSSFDELIMNFTTIFKKTWIGNLFTLGQRSTTKAT